MPNAATAKKMHDARVAAALKLQHLCWDAGQGDKSAFINRDRALEVVDSLVVAILETFDQYIQEGKKDAANDQ